MKLARELSLNCWMFVVTSGGTSWSAGCLGQQIECLKKICVQWHWLPWACCCGCVRGCLWETETWSCIPEVLCLLFVPCGWRQFFPGGSSLSVLVVAISKGFVLQGSTEHLLHPICRDPLQSRAHHSFQQSVTETKGHHHNVLQERGWSNQDCQQLFILKFTFPAGRLC